jgi:microcystin-dependent protein
MHVGEIKMCAFDFPPRGYALCDGRVLRINQYRALFESIGATYGGDGVSTFCLPDLRGRAPMHVSKEPARRIALGERRGEEAVAPKTAQLSAGQPHDNMQPFIAIHFIIALYKNTDPDEPFMGEVRMFAGARAPQGWETCNGQHVSAQQHTALYSLLGTIYGGDTTTAFRLPDLGGRVPIGAGTGVGLSPRALGATGGAGQASLAAGQPHSNMGPYLVCTFIISMTGAYPRRGN